MPKPCLTRYTCETSGQRVGDHSGDANKMVRRVIDGRARALEQTIAGNVAEILEA